MKKNKYIIKFTYPMPGGSKKTLYAPVEITCTDSDSPSDFLEAILEECMIAVQGNSGRAVHHSDLDIKMISLVDSVSFSLL